LRGRSKAFSAATKGLVLPIKGFALPIEREDEWNLRRKQIPFGFAQGRLSPSLALGSE